MKPSDDKRQHPRIELVFKVTYHTKEDFLADYSANASEGGLFIATRKPFDVDEELAFSISFPGLLSPIQCRGQVRWFLKPEDATEERPAGIGVAYLFDSEEDSESMRALIDKLSGEPEPEGVEPPAFEDELTPFRVLLAEDNRVVRHMVRFALDKFHRVRMEAQRNLEVVEAEDGNEAWSLLESQPFDLAVIDMLMPGLAGKDLISRIRAESQARTIPIIAISAGGEDAQEEAHLAGADFFMDKPVLLTQLFDSLHRLLGTEFEQTRS